jgi:hypothetical protein
MKRPRALGSLARDGKKAKSCSESDMVRFADMKAARTGAASTDGKSRAQMPSAEWQPISIVVNSVRKLSPAYEKPPV